MSQGRLFEMVYLLLEKGKLSASALAEHFEVSVRTIYRDVDALSAAGVPVYSIPGRNGGLALMEHYTLSKAALSQDEQDQLLTALKSLPSEAGTDSEKTLSKLSALFHRSEPDWLQVDLSPWGEPSQANTKFQALKEAILSCKEIRFTYYSSYGDTSTRRVHPARLVYKGQGWYLQGFCLDKLEYRTFRISRILDLDVTEHTFSGPLLPPPIQYTNVAPPSVSLHLRFAPSAAYRVYDEFDSEQITALPDGSLEVFATYPWDNWVYGTLLSFGDQVEILSPDTVRQAVGQLAKRVWQKCGKSAAGCQGFDDSMAVSQEKGD